MSAIPTITMHKVASSQFAAIGHVPELSLLAIKFHPKKSTGESDVYHYQNFSAELFAEFLGAESLGSFFIQRIKKCADQFPYVKADKAAFNYAAGETELKPATLAVPVAAAPALTKELLAVALHGREYPFDLTGEEQAQAKAAGLVVIFGADDNLMKLRGAEHGDRNCRSGDSFIFDRSTLVPPTRCHFKVEPIWSDQDDASWTYRTDVPHATFDIMEDGEVYCRGIVINVADLGGAA